MNIRDILTQLMAHRGNRGPSTGQATQSALVQQIPNDVQTYPPQMEQQAEGPMTDDDPFFSGPMTDDDPMFMQQPDGPMTDEDKFFMQQPQQPAPVQPEYVSQGMPVLEGQHARIGDDTRARALAYANALRNV